jgi:hypothetical protein
MHPHSKRERGQVTDATSRFAVYSHASPFSVVRYLHWLMITADFRAGGLLQSAICNLQSAAHVHIPHQPVHSTRVLSTVSKAPVTRHLALDIQDLQCSGQ